MISVSVSEGNLWPLAMRAVLSCEVVFYDAVVDDDEGSGAVAVGVGVFFGGAAVGGPAGVADAVGAVDGVFGEDVGEVAELAGGSAELEGVAAAGDGDAGGVVSAVLEAGEAFHDDGDAGLRADVTDDSTHEKSVAPARRARIGWDRGEKGSGCSGEVKPWVMARWCSKRRAEEGTLRRAYWPVAAMILQVASGQSERARFFAMSRLSLPVEYAQAPRAESANALNSPNCKNCK